MRPKTTLLCIPLVACLLVLVPLLSFSQDQSGITVETISVSPSDFRTGQPLKVAIFVVQAPHVKTGLLRAYLTVVNGDATAQPTRFDTNAIARVMKEESPLAGGEYRTIRFEDTVTIPQTNSPIRVIYFIAGVIELPAEFAQEKIEKFNLKCPKSRAATTCEYVRFQPSQTRWIPVD
jgi:hypothetical protein